MTPAIRALPLLLTLCACGPSSDPAAQASTTTALKTSAAIEPLSDANLSRVCRAAIAALNGHDPKIIDLMRIENRVAYVRYARPSDGSIWKNRCRVEGDRVVWAVMDRSGPGSGPGRWRNAPEDEVITYAISGPTVTIVIRYGDGSGDKHSYEIRPD